MLPCERCSKPMKIITMSWTTGNMICEPCDLEERKEAERDGSREAELKMIKEIDELDFTEPKLKGDKH